MATVIPDLLTVPEMQVLLSRRFKAIRLRLGYKRSTLAQRSGVSETSLKRFEVSGEISLKSLLRLAQATGHLAAFAKVLAPSEPASLAEMEANAELSARKRGRR